MVYDNPAFIGDEQLEKGKKSPENDRVPENGTEVSEVSEASDVPKRDNWGNDIEFLMSCIAMSVGLGNVWRFPFTALENGGGAFLIPYLIVLLVVGRPIYYLEMIVGQFSSRGSAKVYDLCPAMRGVGYGQVTSTALVSTYYIALMSIALRYLFASLQSMLPWAECLPGWEGCYENRTDRISPAEVYYVKVVLKEAESIHDGIGIPDWKLTLFLLGSWLIVLSILIKGVRSSGKASYFLALFPYVVMGILLIRAVTLPGAGAGIMYFITPQWDKILEPDVWYAAVTQCFFSLSVCFGNIIMYASYNRFGNNIYRDATVVTVLDTFTSMIAGCTIFGILGNLAYEVGTDDIQSVVQGGAGLAFVSYPDAIAKFDFWPQGFSVLFFFMLFVLGVGSNVAMTSCVMTVIRDRFPKVKLWQAACGVASVGFLVGLTYLTPGGQFILNLVDFFGASFIAFVLAIAELAAIGWFYGVDRLCKDVEFMLGRKTGIYWRFCWGILTPLLMVVILLYTFITYKPLTYKEYVYPDSVIGIGWAISVLGIMQLPIWAAVAIIQQPGETWLEKIRGAFRPMANWGPIDPANYENYRKLRKTIEEEEQFLSQNIFHRFKRNIFG